MNPEFFGIIAGLFTTGATIPQIIKSYKMKEARDISLLYFLFVVIGLVLWLIYGLMLGSISIIGWNIVAITLNVTILAQKIYYDSRYKA
jgi:MtN3 and saliva related transmembrane protein